MNAVTPTALRLAPSLLVTDAEIDAAVAILEEVLAAMTRHFLEVDDLSPAELAGVLDAGGRRQGRPGDDPAGARRSRRRARVREAVGPHPRRRARWRCVALGGHPIYIRPEEVGIDTRETAEDVARTLAGVLQPRSRRASSTTACSSGWPPSSTSRS